MSWNNIVITICLLLGAFSVYREYQRAAKSYLTWRILAIILAVIALACIILPVSYTRKADPTRGMGKILLTDGFNTDSLRNGENDSVYTLLPTIHREYPNARLLNDIQELLADTNSIIPMHILGYGLDQDELNQLAGWPIMFHPPSIPDGITTANWTEKVKAGEQFRVQGQYKNTSAKTYKLILTGFNTPLDSVTIQANATTKFSLQAMPKNTGRAVYSLVAVSGKDTIVSEQLPVTVTPVQPLKVLILSASPDFESKFLKNWLARNGYGIAKRSTITKGKYSEDHINMDQADLSHITPTLLSKFDVLVGDLSLLKGLSASESGALQQEVRQKGLGVIIRADSAGKQASWLQNDFPVSYQSGKQAAPVALHIQGTGKTAKVNTNPLYISNQNNTQALVTDEHNHVLAAAALSGAGKLIFTTISNSYNWVLAGNQDNYFALWSLLINKAARKLPATENWMIANNVPMINKPARLTLEQASANGNININNDMVSPAQNPVVPFHQLINYWPVTYGWQQATIPNGKIYWWYAWQNNNWKSLTAAGKINATAQYVSEHAVGLSATKQVSQSTRAAVPKVYFYILFIISLTFLWVESKFLSK